jgi:hypothetical protein
MQSDPELIEVDRLATTNGPKRWLKRTAHGIPCVPWGVHVRNRSQRSLEITPVPCSDFVPFSDL